MYRAGLQVGADNCDYDSAKRLGIICPFCKEAVFLRRGNYHERSGRPVIVPNSFAHYGSDDLVAKQCELRAKRQEGIEYLDRLRAESKRQRLKLYNDHLWEMIAADRNISRQQLLQQRKWFGMKAITAFSKTVCRCWQKHQPSGANYGIIAEAVKAISTGEALDLYRSPLVKEETQLQSIWMNNIDQALHLMICCEISDFLGTRTAGYALEKICAACLLLLRMQKPNLHPKNVTPEEMRLTIAGFIAGTHWLDQVTIHTGEHNGS